MNQEKQKFPFTTKEILLFLQRYPALRHLKLEALDKPEEVPEMFQSICKFLCCELTGCDPAALNQIDFVSEQNVGFDYRELHEKSIALLHTTLILDFIFEEIGVKGFQLPHLISPNKKVLVKYLSHLVNYAQFIQEHTQTHIDKVREECRDFQEMQESLESDILDTEQRIQVRQNAAAAREPELLQAKQDCVKLDAWMKEKLNERMVAQNECDAIHKQAQANEKKNLSLKEQLIRAKEEGDRLSAEIVSSPKKLENEVKDLKSRRIDVVRKLDELNSQCYKYSERQQKELPTIQNSVDSMANCMKEVADELNKQGVLHQKSQSRKDEITALQLQLSKAQNNEQLVRQNLEYQQQQVVKLQNQHAHYVAEMKKNLADLEKEVKEAEVARGQNEVVSEQLGEECAILREEIDEIQRYGERMKQQFRDLINQIMDQASGEVHRVAAVLDSFEQEVNQFIEGEDNFRNLL